MAHRNTVGCATCHDDRVILNPALAEYQSAPHRPYPPSQEILDALGPEYVECPDCRAPEAEPAADAAASDHAPVQGQPADAKAAGLGAA